MRWIITIQSITDIITNSSSEVFCIPSPGIEQNVYRLLNLMLISTGRPERAEDIIRISRVPHSFGSYTYDTLSVECLQPGCEEIVRLIDNILSGFEAVEYYD